MNLSNEKYNLIEEYDPTRSDKRFSTLTLTEIYKIIITERKYIMISLSFCKDDEYIRPPDKVIRERLIPLSEEEEEDEQYKKALDASLNDYNQTIDDDIDLDELSEQLAVDSNINMNELAMSLSNKPENKWECLDIPDEFNLEILDKLYSSLKDENFIESRKIIASIENLKHMEWIKTLSYNNLKLKDMINSKNIESYKCLKNN